MNLSYLTEEIRREIQKGHTPLGRILIEHDVMREVEVLSLWRVAAGPQLCELFRVTAGSVTYGRTAIIHCNGEPAIELLEIVTPVSEGTAGK